MLLALLTDPIQIADSSVLFPNTSFPLSGPSQEWLDANNAAKVAPSWSYDKDTEVEEPCDPYQDPHNKEVFTSTIRKMTPEELAAHQAAKDAQARSNNQQRAVSLLSESDWTEVPAVSDPTQPVYLENVAEFKTYRDALRVIAVNPPVTVESWPQKPTEVWVTA